MFGNRFKSDEIANNFKNQMTKIKNSKDKEAALKKKVASANPEDFLVTPEEPVDSHTQELDSTISQVSSYAEDSSECKLCNKAMESCSCDGKHAEAEDLSFLRNKKAEYVLSELGKIANSLRSENKRFAADMVEATAIEIKNEELKKAAEKLTVIHELRKMASESYQAGDILTGDVISVTIENIKNSPVDDA